MIAKATKPALPPQPFKPPAWPHKRLPTYRERMALCEMVLAKLPVVEGRGEERGK